MCTGIETGALLSYLAAAGAVAGTAVSYQTAKNNASYQDKVNAINADQIQQEAARTTSDQERARTQQYEQQASEVNVYQTEAQRQRAELEALLNEYGGGNTANRNLSSLGMRQGQDLATMRANDQRISSEMGFQQSAQLAAVNSKVTGLTPGQKPSKLGLAAGLASTAITAGQRYQSINNPRPSSGTQ